MKKFMEMACMNCVEVKQSYWILIFGSIHFFLSQLPNFNSVAGVSLAAAIMSLRYIFLFLFLELIDQTKKISELCNRNKFHRTRGRLIVPKRQSNWKGLETSW